jgi:ribosomal protein L40E
MFCRNCGKELTGNPEICLGCGARPLVGSSFCHACGAETNPLAEICIKCGTRLKKAGGRGWASMTAGILGIVNGAIGLLFGILCLTMDKVPDIYPIEPILWLFVALIIPMSIVALIGGIVAIKRKIWGLALAGAICSLYILWWMAIPAIVFVAISKREFN